MTNLFPAVNDAHGIAEQFKIAHELLSASVMDALRLRCLRAFSTVSGVYDHRFHSERACSCQIKTDGDRGSKMLIVFIRYLEFPEVTLAPLKFNMTFKLRITQVVPKKTWKPLADTDCSGWIDFTNVRFGKLNLNVQHQITAFYKEHLK